MTPERFWERNHKRIEHAAWLAHEGDPSTTADNKQMIPVFAMKAISAECVEIVRDCGVFCDPVRLRGLLRYLAGFEDGESLNAVVEAVALLQEVEA